MGHGQGQNRDTSGTGTDEKVTVKVAAKALDVSDKTIYRYFKKGLLSKIKEGTRTYVPVSEVRSLRDKKEQAQTGTGLRQKKDTRTGTGSQIFLTKEQYDALLTELGELKERNRLLLEYRATRDMELEETKKKLKETEEDIERLKKPLFRRIVEQVIKK